MLANVEEEFNTEIVIPASRNVQYVLGKALAVGEKAAKVIKTGSTYIFQVAMDPRTGQPLIPSHGIGSDRVAVQHWRDLIGELSKNVLSSENFTVVGQWVLLEKFVKSTGNIITPDNSNNQMSDTVGFKISQLGQPHDHLSVGDEVVVERSRCSAISLGFGSGSDLYYIDIQFVYAKVFDDKTVQIVTQA